MSQGLSFGHKRLMQKIIQMHWDLDNPEKMHYTYNDMLFILQELLNEEGKAYFEERMSMRGYNIFRHFVKHLLYRNIANYDSMILITSEKGCVTGDALLEMPRNLNKYPRGVPLKELVGKGPQWVYSFNVKTQKLELKKSDGIEFVKEDDVWEIELIDGRKLIATRDHPFLLMDGPYKQLKDLYWIKGNKDKGWEFKKSKLSYTDRLRIFVRPHKRQNDTPIKINYSSINRKEHDTTYKHTMFEHRFIGGIIKSIIYRGKQKVYDIVNVQDNHNFIVNGFVVSNTGKSSAAIMMAREWCRLLGIQFNPARHIAYNNVDVIQKIELLKKFEPIVCDESIRFASSEEWNKRQNKELKKKLAQVRTKHLFYILCFPLKIQKVDKVYLESNVNYWIDLFARGKGAIYVKDKNPSLDSWRMKEFAKMGSYTEFTSKSKIEQTLKKHPNFWQLIRFPKPPDWLYTKYLTIREKNVYDNDDIFKTVSKEDIHKAILVLALNDIMQNDVTLTMNRIILHIKNEHDIILSKGVVQAAIEDSRQLIAKVKEQGSGA